MSDQRARVGVSNSGTCCSRKRATKTRLGLAVASHEKPKESSLVAPPAFAHAQIFFIILLYSRYTFNIRVPDWPSAVGKFF